MKPYFWQLGTMSIIHKMQSVHLSMFFFPTKTYIFNFGIPPLENWQPILPWCIGFRLFHLLECICSSKSLACAFFDFGKDLHEWRNSFTKAKFAVVGTFFTNRFPSLRIFVHKKVGKTTFIISVLKVVYYVAIVFSNFNF